MVANEFLIILYTMDCRMSTLEYNMIPRSGNMNLMLVNLLEKLDKDKIKFHRPVELDTAPFLSGISR